MSKEPKKAIIQNIETKDKVSVMYNPTEYSSTRSMVLSDEDEDVQFQSLQDEDFTVTLFFDTYEKGSDVRDLIKQVASWQEPTVGSGDKKHPPACMFSWGGFQYAGVIKSLTQQFILFLDSGVPVRAHVTLTLAKTASTREMEKNAGLDNCRKLCIVRSSDRLDVLAFQQTGLASNWRDIATLNGIEDPLAFPTAQDLGRTLIIPDYHG